MQRLVALISIPILATVWAAGLGVMAARRKEMPGRILYGALALIAALFAAAGWYLLGSTLVGGARLPAR
jgi:hypothetical protein